MCIYTCVCMCVYIYIYNYGFASPRQPLSWAKDDQPSPRSAPPLHKPNQGTRRTVEKRFITRITSALRL